MTVAPRLFINKVWDKLQNRAKSNKYMQRQLPVRQLSLSDSRWRKLGRGVGYLEE